MQNLAKQKGGKCLSKEYVNVSTKLTWKCKEGHIWKALPVNVKKGHWCPACAGVVKSSIEEMQKIAESRGGKCLSREYTNNYTKLKWQCKKGHVWEAMPSAVKSSTWCPVCARKKE